MNDPYDPNWESHPISAIEFYNFLIGLSRRNSHVYLVLCRAPWEAVHVVLEDSRGKKSELSVAQFITLMEKDRLHPTRLFVTVHYRIYLLRKDWQLYYRRRTEYDASFTGTIPVECDRAGDLVELEEGYVGILVYWIRASLFAKEPLILGAEQVGRWRFSEPDVQALEAAYVLYSRAILDEIRGDRRALEEVETAARELVDRLAAMPPDEDEECDDCL